MTDPRIDRLARIVVEYSTAVKPGETVLIQGEIVAEPFLREIYRRVLQAGGLPHLDLRLSEQERLFHEYAGDDLLDRTSPLRKAMAEIADVWIVVWAESNTKELSQVSPARIARHRRAMRPIREIMDRREMEGKFRWCGVGFPTPAMAQEAQMSLMDYENFVFEACLLNRPDPVVAWQELSRVQDRMIQRLDGIREIHVKTSDSDLRVSVEGRRWINCNGRNNFPDGEVFTSPVEDSAEGVLRFNYPAVYHGNEVEGVELHFQAGRVVDARAKRNEPFLIGMLDTDEGARRLGEISIATNYGIQRYTKNILFDEKIGGTMHVAVGSSYPEAGGKNLSSVHWDLIKDMKEGGEITADGRVVYRDGQFVF